MDQSVYLLWFYSEDGPHSTVATLDPLSLPSLARSLGPHDLNDVLARLSAALEGKPMIPSPEPGVYPLNTGWGGLTLQIVRLA